MKAVIVDLLNGQAAALCDDGRVIRLPDAGYALGQIVEVHGRKRPARRWLRTISAVAAALLLSGADMLGTSQSIEYTINRFDYVLSVEGVNEDGRALLAEMDSSKLVHRRIEDALEASVAQLEAGDWSEPDEILISAGTKQPSHAEKLVRALERYDPARGVRFPTFVTPNMVGEVRNYFRDRARALRLPRRGVQLAREIEQARDRLAQTLGRMPRADELAEAMNVPEDHILEALETAGLTLISMDAPMDEDQSLERYLGIEDRGYADFEGRDALDRALDTLTPRRREIIRLRYFDNLSQRETAARVGVSQMTISREERLALNQMKAALDGE